MEGDAEMRLDELVRELPMVTPADAGRLGLEVTGVHHDSRRVSPGDLFVAIAGARFDGKRFAAEAAKRGAVAVLGSGDAPAGLEAPWLEAAEPRALLGPLAARVYGAPDARLTMVGITGTNGKSTVVDLMAAVLDEAGRPAGRLGTLGYRFGDLAFVGERTTPEASDLFRMLRAMGSAGARAVAMEVSSHALDLGRATAAHFDVAVFTNLTRDHLDYHGDMETYFAAKRRLFGQLKAGGRAVVNADDGYGRRLLAELPEALSFGVETEAAVRLEALRLSAEGIRAVVSAPRGRYPVSSPLLGRFNASNLAAAAAAAEALELPAAAVQRAFGTCGPVNGRLERVGERSAAVPATFVDFAHTPAALEAVLQAVRELVEGRVVVVFGCGGDRDTGKREPMGRIAGELADVPVATSDNPRSEDPAAILEAVEAGLRASGNRAYEVVPDRRRAIRRAVELAAPGDAVLVAGKGHEQEQLIGERTLVFSDRDEISKALAERRGGGAEGGENRA